MLIWSLRRLTAINVLPIFGVARWSAYVVALEAEVGVMQGLHAPHLLLRDFDCHQVAVYLGTSAASGVVR